MTGRRGSARRPAKVRGAVFNWTVRIFCGLVLGAGAFALTWTLYPILHRGKHNAFAAVLGAVISQVWAWMFVGQAVLGWWFDEDESGNIVGLATRTRLLLVVCGLAAVALSAVFVAYVGESNPGP